LLRTPGRAKCLASASAPPSGGFTLVEPLIKVGINGTLASVALPTHQERMKRSASAGGEVRYSLCVQATTATFTLTMTRTGAQANDRCGNISLN